MTDGYGQLCPECGDPYIGGRGCYAGACAAEPDEPSPATTEFDRLKRAELPEPQGTIANVLDEWLHRCHGLLSGSHNVGMFLELLAEEGLTVAEEGRLVPPDADTRTQWAVRRDGAVGMALGRRSDAEWALERSVAFARRHQFTVAVPELVSREMRHYSDGSTLVGPWVPVPTPKETPDA